MAILESLKNKFNSLLSSKPVTIQRPVTPLATPSREQATKSVMGLPMSNLTPQPKVRPAPISTSPTMSAIGLPLTTPTIKNFSSAPVSQVRNTTTQTPTVPRMTDSYTEPTAGMTGGGTRPDTGNNTRTSAPEMPTLSPETQAEYDKAKKAYEKSLKITNDELATQADLDRLNEAASKAYTGISDKAIPLEFITGQLQSVENRALNLAQPLEAKLARLQAERTSAMEGSKFAFEEAGKKLEAEQKAIAEASKPREGFTLGKDQVRYDAFGNVVATGPKEETGGAGVTAEAQSWADLISEGKAKISDVPSDIRSSVASAIAQTPPKAGGTPAQQRSQEQADTAITNIDTALQLLEQEGLSTADTAVGRAIGQFLPGSDTRDLKNAIGTVQALIGFDALQKMRDASPTGGALGQVSERELSFLQSVQGSLDITQSTPQLVKNLEKIKSSFERLRAISTVGLTPEEYANKFENVSDAELSEYIERYDEQNQTQAQGNLPQRNNNPGNIKSGGLADSMAIGTDEQGHLIFPDAETGFNALEQDLFAKITGNSRVLSSNPTIAELGKVYAEDPNWPKKIALMLDVPVNTPTANVDFDSLVQAIARQEGFYAK